MLVLFLIFVFIIVGMDIYPQFNTWQSRIHIGRASSNEEWAKKILQKSKIWLKKLPTIKLTDNSRLIIIDILKGNYKRDTIQSWQEASLILGLTEYYNKTNDRETYNQINDFIQSKLTIDGDWIKGPKEIDGVILAYAFLNCEWVEHHKYKKAYDTTWKLIQERKGDDGTIQYRHHMKDYRYVDTIGFICPFLIHYGIKFQEPAAIDLGIRQISTFNQFGMLKEHFIPCHTYHVVSKLPVGLFGWGRGLGWYAIGLIDSWAVLTEENPNKEKLTNSVVSFAKMAIQFQNENGGWNWIVSSKESRTDSSTTATLAWFLANASQIETIKKECVLAKDNALNYLMKTTRRDGAVDFSQGDTKSIGTHSQEFDILPFTQGFCLRTINL